MSKWDAVFEDVEFAKSIIELSPEEAQKALKEKGFDFELDEIMEAGKELQKIIEVSRSGEFDAEALEAVAGGKIGLNFGTGFVVGAVVAACVCPW